MLDAINQLGYRPSLLARGLRRSQTTIVGMIIPDILNPFFPQVVRGVEDVLYKKSYRLMLCNADNEAKKERVYLDELRAYRMAGLIVIPCADSQLTAEFGDSNFRGNSHNSFLHSDLNPFDLFRTIQSSVREVF